MLNDLVQTWFPVIATLGGIAATIALYFLNSRIDQQVEAALTLSNSRTDGLIDEVKRDVEKSIDGHAKAHERLRTQVIDHDRRVLTLENITKALPSKEDVHQVQLGMEKLNGTMTGKLGEMAVRMEDLGRSSQANGAKLDRLEQHIFTREAEKP
ncbi:MAG: hypothetical protein WDN08_05410 [Rhizomicrobium sp.]